MDAVMEGIHDCVLVVRRVRTTESFFFFENIKRAAGYIYIYIGLLMQKTPYTVCFRRYKEGDVCIRNNIPSLQHKQIRTHLHFSTPFILPYPYPYTAV